MPRNAYIPNSAKRESSTVGMCLGDWLFFTTTLRERALSIRMYRAWPAACLEQICMFVLNFREGPFFLLPLSFLFFWFSLFLLGSSSFFFSSFSLFSHKKTRNAGCVAAVQRLPLAMGRTGASAAAGHLAVKITQHVKEQRIGSTITELKSGHPRYRGHLNDGKLQKRFKRVLLCSRLMCNLLRRAKLPRAANITMIMSAKIILFCVKSKSFSQIMILIGFYLLV